MTTPLVSLADFKAWGRGVVDLVADETASLALLAASEFIEARTGRAFAEAAYTATLDGDAASGRFGEILLLPRGRQPIFNETGKLVAVTENGTALTVASGYSTTADVIVKGVGLDVRPSLIRRVAARPLLVGTAFETMLGYWAPGVQNIVVTYTAGAATIPSDVQIATCDLAALFIKSPSMIGKTSAAKGGHSVSVDKELPASVLRVIEARKVL